MSGRKKKTIQIKTVEEDDVIQHILPLSRLSLGRNKKKRDSELVYSPCCKEKTKPGYDYTDTSDSDDAMPMNSAVAPSGDQADDCDAFYGEDVFRFKISKKSGQMVHRAESCASPGGLNQKSNLGGTPGRRNSRRSKKDENSTPKKTSGASGSGTPSKGTPFKPGVDSPSGQAAQRQHKRLECSTPYRLRKRHEDLEEQDGSSSDDSVDESSDEEETGQMDQVTQSQTDSAEAYFDLHSQAAVTSDRTLANLSGPRLDVSAVREALKGVAGSHGEGVKGLRGEHQKLFNRWMLGMCHGYNILLYGLGSKRTLIEEFRQRRVSQFSHVVVNGYFPSLTVKHILTAVTEEILDDPTSFSNPAVHLKYIRDVFEQRDEDFFLIIHNIDGVLIRSDKAQSVLSQLAAVQGFHIIASVDHINAPFLWDQTKCFRFRWLWYETATFLPYESENAYENSLLVQQSGQLALSSMYHVMHSLTPNGRRIFLTLARHQVDHGDVAGYLGMSFQQLYAVCREDFLVNSDLTLQAQLVEFRDHRLIRGRKNFEGVEHLLIPVDKSTLVEFLQEQKEN